MERDQALVGTVAVLALSGYEADAKRTQRAVAYFETRGHEVLSLPEEHARVERFSASDGARLAALEAVLANERVSIVLGLRGGYGLTRLLERIDYEAIARGITERGVRWIGQSDWTALQLALLATTGARTYAGPLAAADFGLADVDRFTEDAFWHVVGGGRLDLRWPSSGPPISVEGVLWGGNLAMLVSLIGTRFMPKVDRGLLFLEDINEHPYRIERMLLQLQMAGLLEGQEALVLGDFSGYKLTEYDQGYDFAAMLGYLRERFAIPIVTGLPFGHNSRKATLPLGARLKLTVTRGEARLHDPS
jgi:muramoyltetrapeptide carboxypeptidase